MHYKLSCHLDKKLDRLHITFRLFVSLQNWLLLPCPTMWRLFGSSSRPFPIRIGERLIMSSSRFLYQQLLWCFPSGISIKSSTHRQSTDARQFNSPILALLRCQPREIRVSIRIGMPRKQTHGWRMRCHKYSNQHFSPMSVPSFLQPKLN